MNPLLDMLKASALKTISYAEAANAAMPSSYTAQVLVQARRCLAEIELLIERTA